MNGKLPEWGGYVSTKNYVIGYFASLLLTLGASAIVAYQWIQGMLLPLVLFGCAFLQSWIQLIFYFNLGKEPKPRWNLIAFYFMLLILLIIAIGSLWIMANLDYRMEE